MSSLPKATYQKTERKKKKLLNMGSSTGQRPEGENQKKWLLVRPLEAQSRMLKGRLLERQCRPLQDPSTRKFTGREWMRSFGIKICEQGLRFISTQRKRQTSVTTQKYNNLHPSLQYSSMIIKILKQS